VARLTDAQRAQLDALRQSYRAELPAKLGLIGSAVDTLHAGGWEKAHLHALYEHIHKLAGSAAIYGFSGISRAAGEMESWALLALDGGLPEARRLELAALLAALQEAYGASETPGDGGTRPPDGPRRVRRRGSASR
jgi:HPt (histidine-containing phosphotransfer) domain-containing protein